MKSIYKYRGFDGSTFSIEKCTGYWKLRMQVPGKIVVIENDIFPTKRAAKKQALLYLWDYTVKK